MILLLKLDSNTIKGEKKEVLEERGGGEVLDPYSMFIFAMNSCATQRIYWKINSAFGFYRIKARNYIRALQSLRQ
jgi:hypothetical protein